MTKFRPLSPYSNFQFQMCFCCENQLFILTIFVAYENRFHLCIVHFHFLITSRFLLPIQGDPKLGCKFLTAFPTTQNKTKIIVFDFLYISWHL